MITVGVVVQWPGLVDDARTGFLGLDLDLLDLVDSFSHLGMELKRAFDRGLRVELGREGNLEKDVLHHVTAQLTLQHHFPATEQHILKTPIPGRGRRRVADFALEREQGKLHGAPAGIPGRPALARAGIGRMPISSQGTSIDPGLAERVDHIVAAAAEHARDHRRGSHAHQQHMIKSDPVEGILPHPHLINAGTAYSEALTDQG